MPPTNRHEFTEKAEKSSVNPETSNNLFQSAYGGDFACHSRIDHNKAPSNAQHLEFPNIYPVSPVKGNDKHPVSGNEKPPAAGNDKSPASAAHGNQPTEQKPGSGHHKSKGAEQHNHGDDQQHHNQSDSHHPHGDHHHSRHRHSQHHHHKHHRRHHHHQHHHSRHHHHDTQIKPKSTPGSNAETMPKPGLNCEMSADNAPESFEV